jgi:hypothetical protein
MRPLYDARLSPGDFVQVRCTCRQSELLTERWSQRPAVTPNHNVLDPADRLGCRDCDEECRVLVSIRWKAEVT